MMKTAYGILFDDSKKKTPLNSYFSLLNCSHVQKETYIQTVCIS